MKDSEIEGLQQKEWSLTHIMCFIMCFYTHFLSVTHKTDKNKYTNSIIVCNFLLSISIKILFPKLLFRKLVYKCELLLLSVSK